MVDKEASQPSGLASPKGKKKHSYSTDFNQQVVIYAEANRNRSAASHCGIAPKHVIEWKKDIDKIKATESKRQRLDGGGRNCIDDDLEDLVLLIYEEQCKMLHVRQNIITWKAKGMLDERNEDPAIKESFVASHGWCEKLM